MGNDGGLVPLPVSDKSGLNGHGGLHGAPDERLHARHPLHGSKLRARSGGIARHVPRPTQTAWQDTVLQSGDFCETVQREARRSERSKAPLSIVRYAIDERFVDEPLHFEMLFAALQHAKRETDFLGHIGTDTLAVLCPDTDERGVRGFVSKLTPFIEGLPVTAAVAATYPEDLFDSLASGTSVGAAFHSFIVPTAPVNNVGHYGLKRAIDLAIASIALVLLAPLMLLVALAIKLTSKGPVIFKQPRLGKGGVPFTFYKFRSMVVNGDDRIHREFTARLIRANHDGAMGPDGFKMKRDPRVTRVGRFIRTTSIDELPQLFNVLRGDMSMVGPRPCIPYEAENYEPWHLRRILAAIPGITGLWQVEGRSRVSFSEMVRMDLRYIRECSLRLDLRILIKTIAVVLRCDGAT